MLWERIRKMPYGTEKRIDIRSIKVPWYFLQTNPRVEKVKKYYDFYNKHGYLDKPITVKYRNKSTNILHNEYIRYLIIANEIDEYRKLHNISKYEDIPRWLRTIPVRYIN